MASKVLLSISGGGLYGVGVANWLPNITKRNFDYISGTSVGSILAALIGSGKYTFEQIKDLFNSDLPKKIFTKPSFPFNLNPVRSATYDNVGAKKELQKIFGDITMKDLKIPTIIVAWSLNKKTPKVFTHKYNNDYKVWEAVLASMSAPTYFPEYKCRDEVLIDGGIAANEPSLSGIAAVREDGTILKNIKCLSLHTTGKPKPKNYTIIGIQAWIKPLIEVITLGNAEYSSYVNKILLSENSCIVAPELPQGDMDDFSLVPKIKDAWLKVDPVKVNNFLNEV